MPPSGRHDYKPLDQLFGMGEKNHFRLVIYQLSIFMAFSISGITCHVALFYNTPPLLLLYPVYVRRELMKSDVQWICCRILSYFKMQEKAGQIYKMNEKAIVSECQYTPCEKSGLFL